MPIGFELVAKTEEYFDKKSKKMKRRSPTSKNEMARQMIAQAVRNGVIFSKDVICPIKSNRKAAVSLEDKQRGHWQTVSTLEIKADTVQEIYLEGVEFPLLLVKQVFKNEDGSDGVLYLISSNTTLDFDQITTIYQRRWISGSYHRSLKQNVSLEKSTTRTETTQTNHFFAALCGYIKLEMLKEENGTNHFALKTKLYVNALQTAYQTLREMNPVHLSA